MKFPKRILSTTLDYFRVPEFLLRLSHFDLVLLYHSVESVRSDYRYSVSVESFQRQLYFLTRTVDVVPLEVMMNTRSDHVRVAITFDDAYDDFFTNAFPLLENFRVPATVFVPTAFVGRIGGIETETAFLNQKSFLNWTQISELHRSGLVCFESHTHTHLICSGASAEMVDDVTISIEQIAEYTGRRPIYFAYPNGVSTPDTHEVARGLGLQAVFTTQRRRVSNGFVHGRYDITTEMEDLSQFKRNIAGLHKDALRFTL